MNTKRETRNNQELALASSFSVSRSSFSFSVPLWQFSENEETLVVWM
jgi:hypothetical protein